LDYRLATITELHRLINQKFLRAGIGIAYPQRDVHLETSKPLDVHIHWDEPPPRREEPRR
jgi:potassium efflux system protein